MGCSSLRLRSSPVIERKIPARSRFQADGERQPLMIRDDIAAIEHLSV
jgi:hypothetical protein